MRCSVLALASVLIFNGCASSHREVKPAGDSEAFVQAEGAQLKVFVYGTGHKTVILVHGGPGLPGYMRSLGRILKGHYRIVEYLQRDSASSVSNGPFTIAAKAADLRAVVEKYSDHGKPAIIAHSGGTLQSVEYAKTGANTVSKLLLIAAAGLDPETDQEYERNLIERLRHCIANWDQRVRDAEQTLAKATTSEQRHIKRHELLDLYWPAYFSGGERPISLQFAKANLDGVQETEADYRQNSRRGVFKAGLESVRVPVIHLHGTLDPLPFKRTTEVYSKAMPNYRFELIVDAGHFPWLDAETETRFIAQLRAHLDE